MTHQPNNVSAAGVLLEPARIEALLAELDWCIENGHAGPRTHSALETARAALAAASAQATAPVGWFVQRSSFGPWIEVERYEDGAVRLHRMDGDQATGQAVQEPVAWESVTPVYRRFITDARYQKLSAEARRWYRPYLCPHCAAPSPAAREAGDGVNAAFAKYDALIGSLEGCTDGGCVIRPPKGMHTNGGCRCVRHAMKMQRMAYAAAQLRKDLGALLREAGSR